MNDEPTRYSTPPLELPWQPPGEEPEPVLDCPGCVELARVREWARRGGDFTTITDANILLRRHPEGH
ncbi:hypothetical protein [Streptomyces sp. CA-253872]|uniref:hypothetical protein n=1 Tax=Streptomyces sp. CA-253872 TaxID=3240067 RepID=UPI003D8F5EC7